MRAYCVFDRTVGSCEAACLVIAKNSKDAKKLGWPIVNDWGTESYIDLGIRWLRQPNSEARDLIEKGKETVLECPIYCTSCEIWGEELNSLNICESCIELEESQRRFDKRYNVNEVKERINN